MFKVYRTQNSQDKKITNSFIYFICSFKCPDFPTYDPNKCYVNGKAFNIGDDVHSDIICQTSCKCTKHDNYAGIICAHGECFRDYKPNCIMTYNDVRHCCSSSEICGKNSFIALHFGTFKHFIYLIFGAIWFYSKTDEKKILSLHTCEVDGYTYYDGQLIFPNDRAYRCHCTPNFNNATAYGENPLCVRRDGCGVQFDGVQTQYLRLGCVPVYHNGPENCPWNTHYTCREIW